MGVVAVMQLAKVEFQQSPGEQLVHTLFESACIVGVVLTQAVEFQHSLLAPSHGMHDVSAALYSELLVALHCCAPSSQHSLAPQVMHKVVVELACTVVVVVLQDKVVSSQH